MFRLCSALIFYLLFFINTAVAEIYKWVDANGQVHFGDQAPNKGSTQAIEIQPSEPANAPAHAAPSNEALKRRQEGLAKNLRKERLQKERAADEQKKKSDERALYCVQFKNRLEHMKTINRFYDVKPDGSTVYLSDQQGDAYRQQLLEQYQRECKK
ncbi:MAG TPA: DUF4124 domain-containing protein [Pseudomonadales bacterium]|nr:DUF4124 domain-containing protein [Pseudomonadales bacterium]